MNVLTKDTLAEFKGEIIDIFEDFCDDNDINIINHERDMYNKDAGYLPGENDVKIFGVDYDLIGDEITYFVEAEFGLYDHKLHENDMDRISKILLLRFTKILNERGNKKIDADNEAIIKSKIKDTFNNWGLLAK